MWAVRIKIGGQWIYVRGARGEIARYANRIRADRVAWKLCGAKRISEVQVVERRTGPAFPGLPPRMHRRPA
jgi:hypothetical protein